MFKIIKLLSISLLILCVSLFILSPVKVEAEIQEMELRIPNILSSENHVALAYNHLAELIEEKSDGKIQVNTFHGGQLGSGRETFEACEAGFLNIATDSYANIRPLTKVFETMHLPGIFESREQTQRVFRDEEIIERVNKELAKINLKWVWTIEQGARQVATTNVEVKSIEDLKGLKLRASRSPLEIAAHKAMGATGVTIDWPEAPEALRTGMVDGLSVTMPDYHASKIYEGDLISYIVATNFQVFANVGVVNKDWWENELTEETKEVIIEAAQETEKWHSDKFEVIRNEGIKEMQEYGCKVYRLEPEEQTRLMEVVRDTWKDSIPEGLPKDLVELILEKKGPVGDKGWEMDI